MTRPVPSPPRGDEARADDVGGPGGKTPVLRLTIVTGLSGSGKSVALHCLEDEGFYCIDNLPPTIVPEVVGRLLASGLAIYERLAIGVDMRSERESADGLHALIRSLRGRPELLVEVLFLDTDRSILVRRFSETRRRHPLSSREATLTAAIDEEARLLDPIKEEAELVVDTSRLNIHELRDVIRTHLLERASATLSLIFQSFGFKHGTPASSDFTFDVRCLPNPHWEPGLRPFTGRDAEIVGFLEQKAEVEAMYTDIRDFLARWLPCFEAENRAYLTVSVGCTGGRHRSVYLVERLAAHFSALRDNVSFRHRELT